MARPEVSLHRSPTRAARLMCAPVLAALVLTSPTPARAVDPGVIYEPGSPGGKEYAIPLEEARREAGSAAVGHGSAAYAPFGVGITPPGGGPSSGGGAPTGGAGGSPAVDRKGDRDRAAGRGGASRGAPSAALARRLAEVERERGGGSATRWTIAVLLAILLPAGVVGLLVSRRREGPKPA